MSARVNSRLTVLAEICRPLELSLTKHLNVCGADEARLAAPTIDPVPHPRLELKIGWECYRHSIHVASRLHQRNQLSEENVQLLSSDASCRTARVDRRQKESFRFIDVADA